MKSENTKPNRIILYGLFAIFIFVNLFEGVLTDLIGKDTPKEWNSKAGSYFEFNYAVSSILDALIRIVVSVSVLYYGGCANHCFQGLNLRNSTNLFMARLLIQSGEVLTTIGMLFLTSSTAAVINQTRIPLVGILGYFFLCKCLTRDQTIYAIAIIPLAIQFNLLKTDDESNELLGYLMCGLAVFFLSASNVWVEKLLKQDFVHLRTWDQQLLFALFDLPVMVVIYVVLTWFEKEMFNFEVRSWNPFDGSNMHNFHWILAFGANGALWGFVRLCILSYEGAMWLNLGMVLVMGLMWIVSDIIIKMIQNKPHLFTWAKLLCLLSLSCILVGYECSTKKAEEKKQEEKWTQEAII